VNTVKKKPYPRNEDIAEAILEVLWKLPLIKPVDFYDLVISALKEKGFYTGLVNRKRVWKVYERMIRTGRIPDYLMVTKEDKELL